LWFISGLNNNIITRTALPRQWPVHGKLVTPSMPLIVGTRIGSFEIVAPLGAGGMGEVYRARDERLGRDVAIKILPAGFTSDVDRLARFEREARVLASLSHPNIASIYGIEDSGGLRALVLELVEGETLAERLRSRGPLSIDEALATARQIAEALDVAHEKGVVHRDLKPANIKITPAGVVKVLDFGLAKALDAGDAGAALVSTIARTEQGVVLGTAAYMSPEQARAQPVDKRTDIWAFGCVVFEMLTGKVAFEAPTMSDIIAKILSREPDWTSLPAATPHGLVRLLRRCLEPDLKRRLRDLGDFDLALQATEPTGKIARPPRGVVIGAGIAAAGLLAGLGVTQFRQLPPANAPRASFEMPMAVRLQNSTGFTVSPDGRRLVFIGTGVDGAPRLWIRSLDSLEARPVSGTENEVGFNTTAFWSADGRSIGFYADGRVKKIDSLGGVPQVVCTVPSVSVGGSWGRDGVIVLGNAGGGLLKCPAAGGESTPVTVVDDPNTLHLFPSVLPDGHHVLYLYVSRAEPSKNGLFVADLRRGPGDQSAERVLATGFSGVYVPTDDQYGRILFARDQKLFAVRFDWARRVLAGEPVQIAEPIGSFRDAAFFSASKDLLVYRGGVPDGQMEWRSRTGSILGQVGAPGPYAGLALSPDATRVAVLRENRLTRADQDLWLVDLTRDGATTRLTSDSQLESVPAWSHDGQTLVFAVGHGAGEILMQPAHDAVGRRVFSREAHPEIRVNPLLTTLSAGPDGRFLVFTAEAAARAQSDLWVLSGQDQSAAPLLQQDFAQTQGTISPDGRWVAYASNESAANDVFVRPLIYDQDSRFPRPGAAILVSRGGGMAPRWRGDSGELFYQTPAGAVMAAPVSGGMVGRPVELFRAPGLSPHWGVTRDGQRFLLLLPIQAAQPPPTVVLNWQSALEP
jgi:hypothetical protein